jgi:Ca-activated chloride channel family protein
VNDELLQQMATVTGGKYFRASKEDSLQGIFKEINSLETSKIEDNKYVHYEEFYMYFALLGMLVFMANRGLAMTLLKVGP